MTSTVSGQASSVTLPGQTQTVTNTVTNTKTVTGQGPSVQDTYIPWILVVVALVLGAILGYKIRKP